MAKTARSIKCSGESKAILLSAPDLTGLEVRGVVEALATGWVAPGGPMVDRFEAALAKMTGFRYALATVSCTAALQLAVRVLGVGPGDEVWCPTLTFIASISPAVHLGATPRFLDIDPETWTLDPGILGQELGRAARRGKLPKLVVATDLYGNPADLDAIVTECARYDVPVVADAAASLGSFARGHHAGYGAYITCVSFNGNKIITTGGGGVLLTDNELVASRARQLANQAKEPSALFYEHRRLGYNCILSNVAAGIGLAQLSDLSRRVAARRLIFRRYFKRLSKLPGIIFQAEAVWARSNRWLTAVSFNELWPSLDAVTICHSLREIKIEIRPLWRPLHLQPVFSAAPTAGGTVAERVAARGLCLPSSSQMSVCDQERVIDALSRTLRRAS